VLLQVVGSQTRPSAQGSQTCVADSIPRIELHPKLASAPNVQQRRAAAPSVQVMRASERNFNNEQLSPSRRRLSLELAPKRRSARHSRTRNQPAMQKATSRSD
jgi:hypothetical protein